MQRLALNDLVQEFLEFIIYYIFATPENIRDKFVHFLDLPIRINFHVCLEHADQQAVICLAVRYVVGSAKRVTHSVHCRAARVAKRNTRIIAGDQEVLQKRHPRILPICRNFFISVQDHLDCLITKHLRIRSRLGRKAGFERVNQRIDGACSKYVIRKSLK